MMIGAFRPSAPLFGGLLWKIPWRMSAPQKLRHRRRLRRVDNIVAVLDNALKRQAASSLTASRLNSTTLHPASESPDLEQHITPSPQATRRTTQHLPTTAAGDQTAHSQTPSEQLLQARKHARGSRQGETLPESSAQDVQTPSNMTPSEQASHTGTIAVIERWKAEMPTEAEMLPRDKYTMFDRKAKKYRKGLHKLPKWTRVSQRLNPPGF